MPEQKTLQLVQSYTRVRLALGFLGLALPLILLIGGLTSTEGSCVRTGSLEPTISDFYHTAYRDIFVGALCAMGVFLVSYRGYPREAGEWISDNGLSTIAGIAGFGLAFFPNDGGTCKDTLSIFQQIVGPDAARNLHYAFALVFFLSLAGFCFFKFSKTGRTWRGRIYVACGYGILLALLLTAIAVFFKTREGSWLGGLVVDYSLIFYFEALGVWAFALSWIVKSRADESIARRLLPSHRRSQDPT